MDLGIRLTLLRSLPGFHSELDKEVLEEEILPLIRLGLNDANVDLVAATLRALAEVAEPCNGNVLGDPTPRGVIFADTVVRALRRSAACWVS